MRVLLISANTERINLPTYPLGLACVAQAALDQGHDVIGLDLMAEEDWEGAVRRSVEGFQPQLNGISIVSNSWTTPSTCLPPRQRRSMSTGTGSCEESWQSNVSGVPYEGVIFGKGRR